MKGIIFTMLQDMIEETSDIDVWENMLDKANPESGGIYTSVETYPDAELFALIGALSEIKSTPLNDLIKAFGVFSLHYFAKHYSNFFEGLNAKQFLMSVEDVIHVEVRKLYPQAGLPTFTYEDPAEDKLIMHYQSPRKLFDFAEGLIAGTAKFYGIEININRHPTIEDTCSYEMTFRNS